jgi:hypothetical protein
MSTPHEIHLLRRDLTAVFEHREESVAIGRGRQAFGRWQTAYDAVNAHSRADEPPLSYVMEFNAAESEWQARMSKMLEDLERSRRR